MKGIEKRSCAGEAPAGGGPKGAARRTAASAACSLRLLRSGVANPLSGCLDLIADHMQTAAKDELAALVDACESLLATAERRCEALEASEPASAADMPLLRSILDYTNANISHDGLGPPGVAQRFEISVRYLHKLFAASGVTFGSYVAMRRSCAQRADLRHRRAAIDRGSGSQMGLPGHLDLQQGVPQALRVRASTLALAECVLKQRVNERQREGHTACCLSGLGRSRKSPRWSAARCAAEPP